jgi:ribosome-associated heat shock protein Hsp15
VAPRLARREPSARRSDHAILACHNSRVTDALTEEDAALARRLDVWLDVACLFKTRSEAQRAVRGGKVRVNDQSAKPHRVLRPGDAVEITRGAGRRQSVVVRGFAPHHLARALARELYEDVTPRPSPERLELMRIERLLRESAGAPPTRAPDRRERRELRRLRGR